VHDYLVENPEVMIEVMTELDKKQKAATKKKQGDAVTSNQDAIYDDPTSFVAGNPKGDVTIVEFFDYNCGFCKRTFAPLMNTLQSDGNIRLILKELPILGPTSVIATHATMAAKKQGKYFEMHKALYMHKGGLDEDSIMAVAKSVGLDVTQLRQDMKDPEIEDAIKRNEELAVTLGITGTPSFIIGGEMRPGAQTEEELQYDVKKAREAKS
jgi:protein-disulfide isomerase